MVHELPDDANGMSNDQELGARNLDPVEFDKDGVQLTKTGDDGLNAPIITPSAFQQPVKRPEITEEQKQRLRALAKESQMTPTERLKQLLTFVPPDESPADDAESPATGTKPENVTTDTEQAQSPVTANTDAPVDEAQPLPTHYKEEGSPFDSINAFLGISDTPVENRRGAFDPDVKLNAPQSAKEIAGSVNLTNQELEMLDPDRPLKVDATVQEAPVEFMEPVAQDVTPPVTTVPGPEEDMPEEAPVTQLPVEEITPPKMVQLTQKEPKRNVVDATPVKTGVLTPPANEQPLPKEEPNIPEMEVPAPTLEPEPEPQPQPEQQPTPEANTTADENELQKALDDLPESSIEIGSEDLVVDEKPKEAATPELSLTEDPLEESELGSHAALTMITSMYSAAVAGVDARMLFTPADLEVVVPDSDIDPSHIVLPNMTPSELELYSLQTDTTQLRSTAQRLFGQTNDISTAVMEGIRELDDNLKQASSYPSRVQVATQQFANRESLFNAQRLADVKEEHEKRFPGEQLKLSRAIRIKDKEGNTQEIDDSFASKNAIFKKIEPNGAAQVQSVSSTKIASILINGYRAVRLYNSGFTVQLAAPRPDLLSVYYNSCIDRITEFGRIFGQFSFLPIGVEKRAALLDLFEACVEGSNLVDWNKPGMLRKAVSVLDIPVIAWALASLMHPKGVDIEYLCYNNNDKTGERCRHVERARIDINAMRYNNWTRMSSDQVLYVTSKEKRTLEDLAKYRNEFCKSEGADFIISEDGAWAVTLRIPTAEEAENAQRTYVALLSNYVQLDKLDKVETYLRAKHYASFAPYIKRVTFTQKEEDGVSKSLYFEDATSLENALDNIQLLDGINLPDTMLKYISSKTLTNIAFTYHPCPKCGKFPVDAVNGLAPCDPEYAFFVWTTARLRR